MSEPGKEKQRRIVVCLDGTNNEPGGAKTNVQKIYRMIDRIPGEQLSYYQPGVGTLEPVGVISRIWRRVLMLADSGGGWMMQRHVCAAYEYLCENYREGDEIYVFGFSRGAQSARILAGMIATVGILHPGMREMVSFAWRTYTFRSPFSALHVALEKLGWKIIETRRRECFRRSESFKRSFSRSVPIRFLGLWDTVGSVGLPWNPRIYNFTNSNAKVQTVRHALSLDERRVNFEHTLWVPSPSSQDVAQVWFPGVHSDIGGGYAGQKGERSKISLAWMVAELKKTGIVLCDASMSAFRLPDLSNAKKVRHMACCSENDELDRFGWKLLELFPIPRWKRSEGVWRLAIRPHLFARRKLPPVAKVHFSVFLRKKGDNTYRPSNIPEDYEVVEPDGSWCSGRDWTATPKQNINLPSAAP